MECLLGSETTGSRLIDHKSSYEDNNYTNCSYDDRKKLFEIANTNLRVTKLKNFILKVKI